MERQTLPGQRPSSMTSPPLPISPGIPERILAPSSCRMRLLLCRCLRSRDRCRVRCLVGDSRRYSRLGRCRYCDLHPAAHRPSPAVDVEHWHTDMAIPRSCSGYIQSSRRCTLATCRSRLVSVRREEEEEDCKKELADEKTGRRFKWQGRQRTS